MQMAVSTYLTQQEPPEHELRGHPQLRDFLPATASPNLTAMTAFPYLGRRA